MPVRGGGFTQGYNIQNMPSEDELFIATEHTDEQADCPSFERRLADVNWAHGTLVTPPPTEEPDGFDSTSIELLDEAEAIVNAAAPAANDDVEKQRAKDDDTRPFGGRRGSNSSDGWQRFRDRFRRR